MTKTTKAISMVTIIMMVSKIFGFAREMVIAAYYGASWQTDAFNMANSIIGLSTAILSMGVATVIIPMYNHQLTQNGKKEADGFASNILCVTTSAYGILSVAGIIFAPFLVKLFAPEFEGEIYELSVQIVRILFIFTIGTNAVNFLTSISHSNKRFLTPALIGFPFSAITVFSAVLLSPYIGIYALVVSYTVAILIQAVMIAVSLRNTFKFTPTLNFTNGDVKAILVLCVPILVSIGVDELNGVIDRMLASGLPEGSISAMNYAKKLYNLPHGIITTSIITVIYPMFSQYAARQDFANVKSLATKAMSTLFAVMAPITLACIYYSREIVKIVYERGAFTSEETALTAYIFIFVILALFFVGGSSVLNNAFYGMQDTKTPRLGAVVAVSTNIVLNLILVRYMQAAGLSLATSISTMVNYVILLIFFRRKCGAFGGLAFVRNIIKCIFATIGMLPVFLLCEFFRSSLPAIVFFSVCVIFGFTVYAILLYVMKVDIFMFGLKKVKDVFRKRS